jgi:deoxyribodipyrimidine photo-lyase
MKRILLWYRNDLRLHDHEALSAAIATSDLIIPVYCFDPRQFGKTAFGFPKTGGFRAQFLLESVANLRCNLQALGSDLVVRWGEPEKIIPELIAPWKIDAVYAHQDVAREEVDVEEAVKDAIAIPLQLFWGATLVHPEDLPFAIAHLPDLFTRFRKQVESHWQVRDCFLMPSQLPSLPRDLNCGELPDWEQLGLRSPERDRRAQMQFVGGETAGLARMQDYIWTTDCLRVYKETRNGMLQMNDSSKLSPWLALGCLSPRWIYSQVKAYETERIANDSTYWLIFELLWRDYFRWVVWQGRDRVFYPSGLQGKKIPWKQDWARFTAWQNGETGYPLVDANMRELAMTGFMSNRGRQNVASFLTKNLGIDWRMGAEWFESLLVDYDVCSNYGNWNYTAGVGNDARGFRYFNIMKQSRDYDPQGAYLRHWLPELATLPEQLIHEPWRLNQGEQKQYQVQLGVDYPRPIVDFFASVKAHEAIYNVAIGRPIQNQSKRSPKKRKS